MKVDLANQVELPQFSQNSNQTVNAPPAAQPYLPQQIPQQYFVQLPPQFYITQQNNQPYLIKPIAPQYLNPQFPYSNQALYYFQPGAPIVTDLKKKLFCPIIWTRIMFILLVVDVITHLLCHKLPIVGISGCITLFIVAYLINQSAENGDGKKYNKGFYLFIIYFALAYIV